MSDIALLSNNCPDKIRLMESLYEISGQCIKINVDPV